MGNSIIVHGHNTGVKARILGIRINTTDSNPATKCAYIDGLAGISSAPWTSTSNGTVSSTCAILQKIKEVCNFRTCHIAAGATSVYKYLKPDDWRYYEDGSPASNNMASSSYNTLTEFPHFYLSITKEGQYLYIRISNIKVNNTYSDWMFSFNGTTRQRHYIGSFLGNQTSSKLYSRAGITPSVSISMSDFRTYSRAQGTGYDMWKYSSLTILQVLYLLTFCNTDSQSAVCPGFTGGTAAQTTGYNYNGAFGEFYRSDTTSTSRFRVFGIEDLWGNLYEYCSDIYTVGTTLYVTDYNTANQSGNVLSTKTFGTNYGGYIQNVMGETYFPFVVAEGGATGSSSTYYCDYGSVTSGYVARSGGGWGDGAHAGVFRLDVDGDGGAAGHYGSRLVFLCPETWAS